MALLCEADVSSETVAVLRGGLLILAALLPPGRRTTAGVEESESLSAGRALHVLEEVSDNLDYFATSIFASVFRAAPLAVEEESTRSAGLLDVAVWLLAVFARAVGYERLDGRALWEWASGDPFCILVLTKGLLAFGHGNKGAMSIWVGAGLSRSGMPRDFRELQDCIMGAVLELTAPDVIFGEEAHGNDVDMAERAEALSVHRTLMAAAVADCGFVDVLIACLESPSSSVEGACHAPRSFAVAAFLRALVATPVDSLPASFTDFPEALVQRLKGVDNLWELLGKAVEQVPAEERLRSSDLRIFVKDCAGLAFAIPPDGLSCLKFLQSCLPEQCFNVSVDVRSNARALAALVAFAANSALEPGFDVLQALIKSASSELREATVPLLQRWDGPLRRRYVAAWNVLLAPDESCADMACEEERSPPVQCDHGPRGPSNGAEAHAWVGLRELVDCPPAQLRCVLDHKLLIDPVRSPAGLVFERATLERALGASSGRCPITGEALNLHECTRDAGLRKSVLAWVRESRPRARHDH